jgi:hypothetical protein
LKFRLLVVPAVLTALLVSAVPAHAFPWESGTCDEPSAGIISVSGDYTRLGGLKDFSVESHCVAQYQFLSLDTPTTSVWIAIAPGAVRTVRRWGLEHLGLYKLPMTGDGLGSGVNDLSPCPGAFINYLIRSDGHVVVDPCGPPPGSSRRRA